MASKLNSLSSHGVNDQLFDQIANAFIQIPAVKDLINQTDESEIEKLASSVCDVFFTSLLSKAQEASELKTREKEKLIRSAPLTAKGWSQEQTEELSELCGFDPAQSIKNMNLDDIKTRCKAIIQDSSSKLDSIISSQVRERALRVYSTKIEDIKKLPDTSKGTHVMQVIFQATQAWNAEISKGTNDAKVKMRSMRVDRFLSAQSNILQNILDAKLKKINAILKLESSGISRADLMNGKYDKQIQNQIDQEEKTKKNIKEQELDKLAHQIDLEEKKEKKKQQKPARERIQKKDVPRQEEEPQEALPSVPSILDPKEILRSQHIQSLYKRKQRPELSRVTKRWLSDVEEIRTFVDCKSNGEKVKRYADLSDEEIKKWKAFHYLPGTEKIFANKLDKQIYCFDTPRGLSMIGEVYTPDGKIYHGTLTFGINSGGTIYHRCFEQTEIENLEKALILNPERAEDMPESTSHWQYTEPYEINFSDKGVITLDYPKQGHSIRIFPIREDLLATHYAKLL